MTTSFVDAEAKRTPVSFAPLEPALYCGLIRTGRGSNAPWVSTQLLREELTRPVAEDVVAGT